MTSKKMLRLPILTAVGAVAVVAAMVLTMETVPQLSVAELRDMIQQGEAIILDVRTSRDWRASRVKIPGARWADPGAYRSWFGKLPRGKPLVLYCA